MIIIMCLDIFFLSRKGSQYEVRYTHTMYTFIPCILLTHMCTVPHSLIFCRGPRGFPFTSVVSL